MAEFPLLEILVAGLAVSNLLIHQEVQRLRKKLDGAPAPKADAK